jgi:hypothetical protein
MGGSLCPHAEGQDGCDNKCRLRMYFFNSNPPLPVGQPNCYQLDQVDCYYCANSRCVNNNDVAGTTCNKRSNMLNFKPYSGVAACTVVGVDGQAQIVEALANSGTGDWLPLDLRYGCD